MINRTVSTPEPVIKQIPLHSCTPRKLVDCFPLLLVDVLNKAPAMGAPIREAMEEIPHDMPSRVPNCERSGQILGKHDPGNVTKPAERKPVVYVNSFKRLCGQQAGTYPKAR